MLQGVVFLALVIYCTQSPPLNPLRVHNAVRGKDVRHQNNRENWLIMFYYKLKGVLVCFLLTRKQNLIIICRFHLLYLYFPVFITSLLQVKTNLQHANAIGLRLVAFMTAFHLDHFRKCF